MIARASSKRWGLPNADGFSQVNHGFHEKYFGDNVCFQCVNKEFQDPVDVKQHVSVSLVQAFIPVDRHVFERIRTGLANILREQVPTACFVSSVTGVRAARTRLPDSG